MKLLAFVIHRNLQQQLTAQRKSRKLPPGDFDYMSGAYALLLLLCSCVLTGQAVAGDFTTDDDLALLETSTLAQVELSSIPCYDQLVFAVMKKNPAPNQKDLDEEALAQLVISELRAEQQVASQRVVSKIAEKYPYLTPGQLEEVRSTAEYILSAEEPASCWED